MSLGGMLSSDPGDGGDQKRGEIFYRTIRAEMTCHRTDPGRVEMRN